MLIHEIKRIHQFRVVHPPETPQRHREVSATEAGVLLLLNNEPPTAETHIDRVGRKGRTFVPIFSINVNNSPFKKEKIPVHWRDGWYLSGNREVRRKSFISVW